jgi:DNA-directed RNA polymerase beta' subunit
MKKLLVLLSVLVLITSCGMKTEETNKGNISNKKIEEKVEEKTEKIEEKFGDLTKYIKVDITDIESKRVSDILKERKTKQVEIKKMIENSTKENKGKLYKQIVEKRKIYKDKISVYISKSKISSFEKYHERVNIMIKKKLDKKLNNK